MPDAGCADRPRRNPAGVPSGPRPQRAGRRPWRGHRHGRSTVRSRATRRPTSRSPLPQRDLPLSRRPAPGDDRIDRPRPLVQGHLDLSRDRRRGGILDRSGGRRRKDSAARAARPGGSGRLRTARHAIDHPANRRSVARVAVAGPRGQSRAARRRGSRHLGDSGERRVVGRGQ